MKKLLLFLMVPLLGCATTKIQVQNQKYKRLAVVSKTNVAGTLNPGVDLEYRGQVVGDQIEIALIGRGLNIVERSSLEHIFRELNLNLNGSLSQESLKEIGKISQVDALIIVTVMIDRLVNYDTEKISVKMVDVQTGSVICGFYYETPTLFDGPESIARKISKEIMK